jgi:hypothetical protein
LRPSCANTWMTRPRGPLPGPWPRPTRVRGHPDRTLQRPRIRDTIARLCAESSDRIPKRRLPVVRVPAAARAEGWRFDPHIRGVIATVRSAVGATAAGPKVGVRVTASVTGSPILRRPRHRVLGPRRPSAFSPASVVGNALRFRPPAEPALRPRRSEPAAWPKRLQQEPKSAPRAGRKPGHPRVAAASRDARRR